MSWSDLLRYLGVALAVVGLLVVAPQGVDHAARKVAASLKRKRPHELSGSAHGTSTAEGYARGTVQRWRSDQPVGEQLRALNEQHQSLDREVGEIGLELFHERRHRRAEDARVESVAIEAVRQLRSELQAADRTDVEIDASGLVPVGVGIVLSGIPDELGANLAWFITSAAAGAAVLVWSVAILVRHLKRIGDERRRGVLGP